MLHSSGILLGPTRAAGGGSICIGRRRGSTTSILDRSRLEEATRGRVPPPPSPPPRSSFSCYNSPAENSPRFSSGDDDHEDVGQAPGQPGVECTRASLVALGIIPPGICPFYDDPRGAAAGFLFFMFSFSHTTTTTTVRISGRCRHQTGRNAISSSLCSFHAPSCNKYVLHAAVGKG
jgi:hypothetical protein